MTEDTRAYTFEVSETLFRLATEGVHLRSNETKQFQSLGHLVNARAAEGMSALGSSDVSTLKTHLSRIPTKGPIKISLTISKTSAKSLSEAKERLGKIIGEHLTLCDALSLLLFDYIAQTKADRLIAKAFGDEASGERDELRNKTRDDSNVIRLR